VTLDVLIASALSMYVFSSFDIVLCAVGVSDEKNHHATNHDRPNNPANDSEPSANHNISTAAESKFVKFRKKIDTHVRKSVDASRFVVLYCTVV